MPANPYLAEAMLRASRPTFELGLDIRREEEEEWRLEEERRRGMETRERKRGIARGRGRVGGGILGFLLGAALAPATGGLSLLIPAAAAGLGSYTGQKVATDPKWGPPGVRISPGAMKKFERIGPGKYYVSRGEEREREFEWGETERGRYMQEQILMSSLIDALSGGLQAKYGRGILDMILGGGGGSPIGPLDLTIPGPFEDVLV